jgi:hypothetical protein
MGFAIGSFLGGAAAGYEGAKRLGLQQQEQKDRHDMMEMEKERRQIELDQAQQQKQTAADIQRFSQSQLADPVYGDEGATGTQTIVGYKPKELDEQGKIDAYRKIGQYAMSKKIATMSPGELAQYGDYLKKGDEENYWKAMDALLASGGKDIDAAKKVANAGGKVKIVDALPYNIKDQLGERQGFHVRLKHDDTGAVSDMIVDPLKVAFQHGGREGYLQHQTAVNQAKALEVKAKDEERKEKRDEQRHLETLASIKVRDRAVDVRANGRESGSNGGVYEVKRNAYLAVHPGDEQGALDYAGGRKSLGPREARLAAERMANSSKDENGLPLSPARRKSEADRIYQSIIGQQQPAAPGLTPVPAPGAAPGAAPAGGAPKDYSALWR